MKKLLMMLAAVGMIFTACEGNGGIEEENGGASIPKIELSQQSIEVDFEPNTYTVSVTSPYYWKAESDNDWIVVESKKGDAGTEELSFKVERNEEENERKGSVFIYNSPYNLVAELNVIQKPFIPEFSIEYESLNFAAEGETQEIAITSNFKYEVSTSADWLSYTKTDNGITITASAHIEIGERIAEVTIYTEKYNKSSVIKVTQNGFSEEDTKRIIFYTSTYGQVVEPYKVNSFGANIVSNTNENGFGIIKFDAPITSIGREAFYDCRSLTSVTIPNSVTSIGSNAFNDCRNLRSVTIPNSVTSIEWRAFYNCISLTSITIPDSVTSIASAVFEYCSSLTSVTIGNSVTSIGWSIFEGCSSLTNVTIGNSVTSIGYRSFYGCSSLTNVTIPNSVTSIEGSAFSGCSSLAAFYGKFVSADNRCLIIDGVLKAFAPAGLISYTIPDSVTSIGNNAFYDCSSLTSIIIPDSVTSIGVDAFYNCSSLISVTIPDSVTEIASATFGYCSSLTSITIPDSVTSIGYKAFNYCSSLTSITIPDSVTSIGYQAFSSCSSLTSVTIGNGVTSIASWAFTYCYRLTNVYCKATTPPRGGEYMFDNNASGRKIHVPTASVSAYKSAQYWKDYKSDIVGYDF